MHRLSRNEILEELAITDLPPETRDAIVVDVAENILTHVLLATLERLPVQVHDEFKRLALTEDNAAQDLAALHIPNFDSFVVTESREALMQFKRLLAA